MGDISEPDEWDPARGTFAQHAVAGSLAGLAEHGVTFPLDTLKTLMQVRPPPDEGLRGSAVRRELLSSLGRELRATSQLLREHGSARLWRGAQALLTGCIPAHGAYFSVYEGTKPALGRAISSRRRQVSGGSTTGTNGAAGAGSGEAAAAAGAAVALGTMVHDLVMTPIDVCKQRLQLGLHQNRLFECACSIMRQEGPRAFLLSYPTTLLMNIPYALVMGFTNEQASLTLSRFPHMSHPCPLYITRFVSSFSSAATRDAQPSGRPLTLRVSRLWRWRGRARCSAHESARRRQDAPADARLCVSIAPHLLCDERRSGARPQLSCSCTRSQLSCGGTRAQMSYGARRSGGRCERWGRCWGYIGCHRFGAAKRLLPWRSARSG